MPEFKLTAGTYSNGEPWAPIYDETYPGQLQGRLSKENWTAFITQVNGVSRGLVRELGERHPYPSGGGLLVLSLCLGMTGVLLPVSICVCFWAGSVYEKEGRAKREITARHTPETKQVCAKWNESEAFTAAGISVTPSWDKSHYTTVSGYQGSVSSQVHTEYTYFLIVSIADIQQPLPQAIVAPTHRNITVVYQNNRRTIGIDSQTQAKDLVSAAPSMFPGILTADAQGHITKADGTMILPTTNIFSVTNGPDPTIIFVDN